MSLVVQGLSVGFGRRVALKEVSLEFARGRVTLILGPNGSGKSTLLRAIAGIRSSATSEVSISGSISLDGVDLSGLNLHGRASRVAYVGAELSSEFPVTVNEAVELGLIARGSGNIDPGSALRQTECEELADRRISELSGGERQRVAIARALVQDAPVWLLDESLSKMDIDQQLKISRLLRQEARVNNRVIALVSHDYSSSLSWAEDCLLMKSGSKVAFGAIGDALNTQTLGLLYPGSGIQVRKDPETGQLRI